MPSGKRYRVRLWEVTYDLSPEQFDFLTKKSFKLKDPVNWKTEQRIKGLTSKRLLVKKNGRFIRTKLGSEVLSALKAKV